MKISNERKAGVILTYLNMIIGTIVPFLYTPVMLRLLGQAEYGLYGLSSSVTSYLSLLSLGLGSAIVRYMMKYRANEDKKGFDSIAGLFLFLYSIIAVVTIVCGFAFTQLTGVLFGEGLTEIEVQKMNILLIVMSVCTAVAFISSVYTSIITCFEKYVFIKVLAVISTIVVPILNILVLYVGGASVGMAVVSLALQGVTCVVYIWYCSSKLNVHPTFKAMPFFELKDIFKYCAFVMIGIVADMLYWATDKVLIGAALGTVSVAVYNVGGTFQSLLQNLAHAVSNVFTPQVNRAVFKDEKMDSLSDLLVRIGRLQYLIISLALTGFTVFGRAFIQIWAGDGYEDAYFVAILTMYPLAIPLIESIAFAVISAKGMHRFRSVVYAILAIANAVSTYLLIPIMGIIGAALCTCVVFVVGHGIIMNWYYYKKVGLDIPRFWINILKMSIVPACLTTLFLIVDLKLENIGQFFAGVILYTALFAVLSWFISMNSYEKNLILGFLKKRSYNKE